MNVRYSITLKSEKLAYMQMLMGCKPELQRQYNNTVARYLMGYKTLEPYAMKVARTVLRRGGASNRSSLFDVDRDQDIFDHIIYILSQRRRQ